MSHKYLIILILGVAISLAACGGEPAIDPLAVGDPERGREIFENGTEVIKHTCTSCHSLDGTESHKIPTLQGISERAGNRVPDLSAVEYLRQSILDPSAHVVEGSRDGMDKGYKYGLSEEEVNDLVAFLLTQ